MGTRSTYRIISQYKNEADEIQESPLALIYFQYDGYPSGHPSETAEWLASGKVVNGYGNTDTLQFNGAGCLAAQMIAKYKQGVGGVYLHDMATRGNSWEDYLYDIIVKEDNSIEFVCYENNDEPLEIFRGAPSEFVEYAQKDRQEA
jgi:hypothetical protein